MHIGGCVQQDMSTCQIVARRLTSIRGHCPTMYNVMPGPEQAASLVRQHGLSRPARCPTAVIEPFLSRVQRQPDEPAG